MPKPKATPFVLGTAESGVAIGRQLEDTARSKQGLIVVDFEGVEGMDMPFCREFFGIFSNAIRKDKHLGNRAVFTGLSIAMRHCMTMTVPALRLPPVAAKTQDTAEVELLGYSNKPQLVPTFSAAKKLTQEKEAFSAPELADALEIGQAGCDNRLDELGTFGAVGKIRGVSARAGVRYLYRAVVASEVTDL